MGCRSVLPIIWLQEELMVLVWKSGSHPCSNRWLSYLKKSLLSSCGTTLKLQDWELHFSLFSSKNQPHTSAVCITRQAVVNCHTSVILWWQNVKPWALQMTAHKLCIFFISFISSRKLQIKEKRRVSAFQKLTTHTDSGSLELFARGSLVLFVWKLLSSDICSMIVALLRSFPDILICAFFSANKVLHPHLKVLEISKRHHHNILV